MKKNISIIYFLLFVYSIANAQDSLYFRANAYKEQLDNYYSMDEKDFPKPGSILFIGSSSLGMWKNTGSYFPNHRVLNRAYGGSWISDYLYHYQRLVVAYKPAQIVLLCGANDLYNGVSIERVFEDIKCFCRLLDIHLPPFFSSIPFYARLDSKGKRGEQTDTRLLQRQPPSYLR